MSRTEITIENIYPLTPMQEGMLYHSLQDNSSSSYNQQVMISIKGLLDVTLLNQSINMVIDRHDVLRSIFNYKATEKPLQIILEKNQINTEYVELIESDENEIENFLHNDLIKGFDLSKDKLIRLSVIKKDSDEYIILWSFHHILIDGWSVGVILKDIFECYSNLIKNQIPNMSEAVPYRYYLDWLKEQNSEASKEFWSVYLKDYSGNTGINWYQNKSISSGYINKVDTLTLNEKSTQKVIDMAQKYKVTINTVFKTLWGILLYKYTGTEDVVFGTVVSGRPPEIQDVEKMVGMFINTNPTRVTYKEGDTIEKLLNRVQKGDSEAFAHNHYPLYKIQNQSNQRQDLIDHILVFENFYIDGELESILQKENLGFEIVSVDTFEQTSYDLNVIIVPGHNFEIKFRFNGNKYSDVLIEGLKNHFLNLLTNVSDDFEQDIRKVSISSEEEYSLLINGFNNVTTQDPKETVLHSLFEKQVEDIPNQTALVFHGDALTYKELNEQANQLGRYLLQNGTIPGDVVAIYMERSLETVIAILAISKIGAAYLPIEVDYPGERINHILINSQAQTILVGPNLKFNSSNFAEINLLSYPSIWELSSYNVSNIEYSVKPRDLMYILYTSGTTGVPKGVMIEHGNALRLLINDYSPFQFRNSDIFTLFHSYCFDLSVWEMWGALASGGKLIIVPNEVIHNPDKFLEMIRTEKVSVLTLTPTAFYMLDASKENRQLIPEQLNLRYLIFAGEKLNTSRLKPWKEKYTNTQFINMYGITEITVHATFREITDEDISSNSNNVGLPLSDLQIYILDQYLNPVPIGVLGEIYVGGAGVARGYMNQSTLTEESFVSNPFQTEGKIYKSGDLAKWDKFGCIHFFGRKDSQVKIRGHRVELEEIEGILLTFPGIENAAVTVEENEEGGQFIHAYVVSPSLFSIDKLRNHLSNKLPHYMIPTHIFTIESIPKTINGKLDTKKLLEGGTLMTNHASEASENQYDKYELILLKIWSSLLGKDQIGIDENFYDLGGHSILVIKMEVEVENELSELGESLGDLTLTSLIDSNPTISELATLIRSTVLKLDH